MQGNRTRQAGANGRPAGRAPRSVVIFRALQLGDMLCAVPALRAMRRAWPSARLALAGLPWAAAFVKRFGCYLDDFLEFPGFPGLPERPPDTASLPAFLHGLRARRHDLAVQMHGDGSTTNAIVAAFGAAQMAGFGRPPGHWQGEAVFVEYPRDRHEIRRLLSLTSALGLPAHGEHLEFPLGPADEAEWAELRGELRLEPGSYACLHPGARAEERRWPPEQFARLGALLAARGLRAIVTGEGEAERRLAAGVAAAVGEGATSVAGRTSLGAMAALVRDARLIVCNDTGLSHVAAAVGTPSVVVFRTTDPRRWAPLDTARHRVVLDGPGAAAEAAASAWELLARESTHAA